MRIAVLAVAVVLVWASSCVAQTATEPALHHRAAGSGSDGTVAQPSSSAGKQRGSTTLPEAAQGEYMLDDTGSVVQITIEHGTLDGYISRLTDGQTASITYFFDRTTINGDQVTFTTKEIHGTWYSFDGAIVRGDAGSKEQTGFYRLKGTWVTHDEAGKSQSTRMVSLKSTPRGPTQFPDN